jgi:predicted nucleic acid-binding protein
VSVLLDTNVLSELRRGPQANENVRAWEERTRGETRFTSIIVIAELMKGVEIRARNDAGGGAALDRWVRQVVIEFEGRILPVDLNVASVWARLMAARSRPPIDMLIAATAVAQGFVLATRNASDFEETGARLINPWTFAG